MSRLILHDLDEGRAADILGSYENTFPAKPTVNRCIGCFGCWVKTPGICVIDDRARGFVPMLAACDELFIVSRCVFGGLSPDIKAVLDRSIGYLLPYFRIIHGEMHHVPRYNKEMKMEYILYGDITNQEQQTAKRMAEANALNFNCDECSISFVRHLEMVREALKCA